MIRRRRRHCRSEDHARLIELTDDPSTSPSSLSSFALTENKIHYIGKRKRSRTIHEDFRVRNSSSHDYEMAAGDETNLYVNNSRLFNRT
jgi:hypothetical protein